MVEPLRLHYEIKIGRRVADSHWSVVKKRIINAGLELSAINIDNYLEVAKHLPRYRNKFYLITDKLKSFSEYLGNRQELNGTTFTYYLKAQNINASQPTISRWFDEVGGFKKARIYTTKELLIVAVRAFIYQIKHEVNNNG